MENNESSWANSLARLPGLKSGNPPPKNNFSKVAPDGTVSTFATGLNGPYGLAFDASWFPYVANYGNGTISKIASNGTVSTFVSGLSGPSYIAFAPAAVPEASTTVSLGVLLALGLGGVVIAARRRSHSPCDCTPATLPPGVSASVHEMVVSP